ncbi:hypothetical protein Golax_024330, partial [Gossypium laxum]|nr:hypothetical protein [Gossypium laxum]
YGHVKESCTFRNSELNAKKKPAPPELLPKNHSMVVDRPAEKGKNYGPWMLVERKPRWKFRHIAQKNVEIQEKHMEGSRFRSLTDRDLNP